MYLDVGEGSDYLLLGREICALLELEIADGTRQGKVAIDTAEVDKTAGCLDTGLLGCGLSDMLWGQERVTDLRFAACGRRRAASPFP